MKICDMHAHLLPGIDDGSDSWETTMAMIRLSRRSGVRVIIATPHNIPWEKHHNTDRVASLCREAQKRAEEENIDIRVLPGQEIYYHHGTVNDLDSGQALTLAGTSFVLVEFNEMIPYTDLRMAVMALIRSGYTPIIAHFERFPCLQEKGRIQEIKEAGAKIQSNIHAMAHMGTFSATRRFVRTQYRHEIIDFVSSDMHNMTTRSPIRAEDMDWYRQHLPDDYRRKIFWNNAKMLFDNEKGSREEPFG